MKFFVYAWIYLYPDFGIDNILYKLPQNCHDAITIYDKIRDASRTVTDFFVPRQMTTKSYRLFFTSIVGYKNVFICKLNLSCMIHCCSFVASDFRTRFFTYISWIKFPPMHTYTSIHKLKNRIITHHTTRVTYIRIARCGILVYVTI